MPILAIFIRGLRDSLATQKKKNFLKQHESFLKKLEEFPEEKGELFRSVDIDFLGLWDTVDAYGLPIDELTMGWDRFVWPLSMRNRDLSAKVKKAVHALSLDDERNSFHPLLWNEMGDSGVKNISTVVRQHDKAIDIKDEILSQVWFAGMHANVGGGYPDDFLSYVPLNFILKQVESKLIFNPTIRMAQKEAARVPGVMHDSRSGLSSYYRYLPRKLLKLLKTERWATRIFHRGAPKQISTNVVLIKRPKIHHSVFDRITASGLGYSPIVLPAHYAVVMPEGEIENLGGKTLETPQKAGDRAKSQEQVWDIVWLRRVTYFNTLFFTGLLVLLPWVRSFPTAAAWWPQSVKIDSGKCIDSIACFMAGIPNFLGAFLPSFASTWLDSFSANLGIFLVLSLIIALLMYGSSHLDGRIHDRMHALWLHGPTNTSYSRLYKFRESATYQWLLLGLKHRVLPALFGLSALVSILFIAVSGASRILFSLADSTGKFCETDVTINSPAITNVYSNELSFSPSDDCWRTGLWAEEGATYRVVLNIADTSASWKDDTLEADLLGNRQDHDYFTAATAWLSKRYLRENYYKPIARIRNTENFAAGQDEYVLNPTFGSSRERYYCLVSDFTAQSSGELFLFVNDAIIYVRPDALVGTYKNNLGKAEVYVKRIVIAGEPFAPPPDMNNKTACDEFKFSPP